MLTIDNPPVNALGQGVWEAIDEAVARAANDADADAIVLIGAGTTFVAGADINVFKTLKTREQSLERSGRTHAMLKRLEDVTKPLVAAIHGNALGGGLELAQACHYRVATADAKVGQPEVAARHHPGAGGTQRLPRLCGAELALEMCTDGKPVAAAKAKAAGILDAIIDGDLAAPARSPSRRRAPRHTQSGKRATSRSAPTTTRQGVEACRTARARAQGPKGVRRAVRRHRRHRSGADARLR